MKPEEILAAKAVMDLAVKIRSAAFEQSKTNLSVDEFVEQNPLRKFVPDAIKRLKEISDMIQASNDSQWP